MSAYRTIAFTSRDKWLEARRRFIGSSDVACLYGLGYADQSTYTLFMEKAHGVQQPVDAEKQRLFDYGQNAEPFLRWMFEYESGYPVAADPKMTIRVSLKHPFMGASLDGYCETEEGTAVTELKFLGVHQLKEVREGCPHKYQIQIQHQLAVTGWSHGYLMVAVGNQPIIHRVDRHERMVSSITETCGEFWERIQSGTPPEIDGSEATYRAIARQFPEPLPKKVCSLSAEYSGLVEQVAEHDAKRKAAEEEARRLKSRLFHAMEDANYGVLPDGTAVEIKKHGNGRRLKSLERLPREVRKHIEQQGLVA